MLPSELDPLNHIKTARLSLSLSRSQNFWRSLFSLFSSGRANPFFLRFRIIFLAQILAGVVHFINMPDIRYSEKYFDDTFEYRHVILPPEIAKLLPKNRLLAENEWRAIGVQQSRGWVHYAIHRPEPHIMLFRRPLNYQHNQQQLQTQQQP